jgi:uncharacterized membrane protein YoaK (UPF0700 family)
MGIYNDEVTVNKNNIKQMSDTFWLGALLAIAGGYLDAYTYIARGKVFANAQTGNMVLFGIRLIEGKIFEAVNYFIPILAFVAGILVAEGIRGKFRTLNRGHWRQIVLGIEILALLVTSFIPQGSWNMVANTLISFVCALQVESFRKVNGITFASTMCTGNLRSGTECLYQHLFKHDKDMKSKWLQYYGIILFFVVGAGIGALLTGKMLEKSVLVCCVLLFAAILIMCIDHEE